MIFRPMLIPFFSGVHTPKLKTCLLFDNYDHAHVLESVYRPYVMSCLGDDRRFGSDLHHVEQIILFDDDIEYALSLLHEQYNLIVHTDNHDKLDALMGNSIYGFRTRNVALSTGVTKQYNLKELAKIANTKLTSCSVPI